MSKTTSAVAFLNPNSIRSLEIKIVCWIIDAVSIHIASSKSLTGGYCYIRIEEPSNLGIVVSGLEVIELVLSDITDSSVGIFYSSLLRSVKVVSSTYISVSSYHFVSRKGYIPIRKGQRPYRTLAIYFVC